MAGFITFLIIFLSGIFEITFLSNNISPKFVPDPMLLVVIFWVASESFDQSWKKIVLAGFVLDIISFNTFGFNTISFAMIAFAESSFLKRFFVSQKVWGFSILLFLVLIATVGNIAILNILEKIYNFMLQGKENLNVIPINDSRIFFKLAANFILFAIIYQPLEKLGKLTRRINERKKGLA